jgi:hypothetical protein
MSDRALIQNMLLRNALYNDGLGSTAGAGLYNRRAGAGYIGGAKYNRQRGGAMLGGCHCCSQMGCMGGCENCGYGYIGGFAGENLERRRIKAMYPGKGKSVMDLRRQEFNNYLKLHPDEALAYADEKLNRSKGRSNYSNAIDELRLQYPSLSLKQIRDIYKGTSQYILAHPKPVKQRGKRNPNKVRVSRVRKGCSKANQPPGLWKYCRFREDNPGLSREQLSEKWLMEKDTYNP